VWNYPALSLIGEGPFQGNPYFGLLFQPIKILLKSFLFCHPPHGFPHNEALVPCSRSGEALEEPLCFPVDGYLNLLHCVLPYPYLSIPYHTGSPRSLPIVTKPSSLVTVTADSNMDHRGSQ
jgi:hypothetical protein